MTTRIAVFASGRGTNFDAVRGSIASGKLDAEIVALVSDSPEAPAIGKARAAGIRTIVREPGPRVSVGRSGEAQERRRRHEQAILAELRPLKPEFLVLAGYMRLLTPELISEFRSPGGYSRIVNIHPSLLPSFPGLDPHGQALRAGVKISGATVHFVIPETDAGPVVAQAAVPVRDDDTAESLSRRVLAAEHRIYPLALKLLAEERVRIVDGRCVIAGARPSDDVMVVPEV